MGKTKAMSDTEIRINGIDALNKALGTIGAYRFLTLLHNEPTDYVEISRRLYNKQSIDEIIERSRKNWKE